jgi:hypothetical protein
MIDHERKIILIHIPKCAGSSVEQLIVGKDWWFIDPPTKHLTAQQMRQHYGENVWNTYYKIVVIRNPWTRLISSYLWHKNCSSHIFKEYGCETFDAYVRKICVEPYLPDKIFHGGSIMEYIADATGKIMVDYICRSETIEQDLAFIRHKYNITGPLGSRNRQEYDHDLSKWYTPELQQIVAKRYEDDIRIFGYFYPTPYHRSYFIPKTLNPPHQLVTAKPMIPHPVSRRVFPRIVK